VIQEFVSSWELFSTSYVAGWLIAVTLALVGVWVVARDQIFLGVAVAQASTIGIAAALWLGGIVGTAAWLQSDAVAATFAVAASVGTALLTARERRAGAESAESVTGWVYLVSASVPVLMMAHQPHGLEEIHRLMFSTLLGASTTDLWVFGGFAVATAIAAAVFHSRLLLFALDSKMAAAVGMRRGRWNAGTAIWLGVAVGLSIRVSGTLYTFGCLVLPALIAKNLSHEIRPLLLAAPFIAGVTAVVGFVLANHFDVPPAHVTVAMLCGLLAASWCVRAIRNRGSDDDTHRARRPETIQPRMPTKPR
jgi:ABC-type Mn2+/Zn2+ transport system permease subunit